MNFVEFTGKTVEEAVETGLKELGLTKEEAEIRVLEEGKKKLFGSVKARVEIAKKGECDDVCDKESENVCACACEGNSESVKECEKTTEETVVSACKKGATDGERTVEFLEGLFNILKITACTELVSEKEKIEINVIATKSSDVIGKHGATLDAIQTLAGAVANTGRDKYKRVVVDCENYRENRENTLNKLADNLAEKANRLGKKIKLEPMNPYERRIIHSALSARDDVKTISEGKEPNRYIVVIPENLEDPDAEPIPARSERKNAQSARGGRDGGRGGRNGSRGFGGRNGGGNRKFNRDNKGSVSSGGTSLKNNDFFGIFLGNSGNNGDEE